MCSESTPVSLAASLEDNSFLTFRKFLFHNFLDHSNNVFLDRLTLEISEIDKFKSLKAFICPFSILLSLFPESIYNNVN